MKSLHRSLFALVALLLSACPDTPPMMTAQLDHLGSGALVTCDAYAPESATPEGPHTCMVFSNPLRPFLRIFDVSQGQFISSPIGYSPLALRIDGLTTQLESFEVGDKGLIFALNANSPAVAVANSRYLADGTPSFSSSRALPKLNLAGRPQKMFVAAQKANSDPQLLFALDNGTLLSSKFNDAGSTFQQPQQLSEAMPGTVLDSAYDPTFRLFAFLVNNGVKNSVVIKKLSDDGQSVSATDFPIQNEDLGSVKIAIGPIKTTPQEAPHLLLMKQDKPELRVVRLDSSQPAFDNKLAFTVSLTKAYFPKGEKKETCCSGKKEWISVGSNGGLIYFLSDEDLRKTETKIFEPLYNLGKISGFAENGLNGLIQILGGDVRVLSKDKSNITQFVCSRQMFYLFESGFAASTCEGNVSDVTRIISR